MHTQPFGKACLAKGITTWLVLKYLGPEDGKTIYELKFPDPPKLVVFTMKCSTCSSTDHYSRNDVEALSTEQPPDVDFVDQLPGVLVYSNAVWP